MRLFLTAAFLTTFIWQTADACVVCTNNSTEPIEHVPPPWTLYATCYAFPLIPLTPLPAKAYSPLERNSTATEGEFLGLVGAILIVRYNETPVGPYDELVIIPGYFEYNRTNDDGTIELRQNIRGSRFYVSQKYTNWNGRINWNIPKHLARFDWTDGNDGSTSVKIYPFDTQNDPNDSEPGPSSLPFFQMAFKPALPNALPIPIDTNIFEYLGVNSTLGQPPLPAGNGSYGELPGTSQWAETTIRGQSNYTTPGFFDLDQGAGDNVGNDKNAVGDEYFPNFWPDLPRWNVGAKLEQATISFPVPEEWD